MDRAEAIEILKRYRVFTEGVYHDDVSATETFDLAIEALKADMLIDDYVEAATLTERGEAEPYKGDAEPATTTDCISRQQAIEALDRIGSVDTEADREYARNIFNNLPPVTPTERTGEWVVHPLIDDGRVELECSECGDTFVRAVDYKPDFCETCGAKMGGDTE